MQAWMDIGPITSPRKVLTASIMFILVAYDSNTASKVTSAYIAAHSKPHNQQQAAQLVSEPYEAGSYNYIIQMYGCLHSS